MKVGIIGGGGGGVAMLAALTAGSVPDIEVTVFEPATLGPGRAYLADADTALLNVSAGRMSVLPDGNGHFLDWVRERDGRGDVPVVVSPGTFLPRRVFGEYLSDVAADIGDRLIDDGQGFRLVRSAVLRLDRCPDGFRARTADGRRFEGLDRVVLCVGSGGPVDVYRLAGDDPFYVDDPYPLADRLADVDPDARVLVLGTGLTAVDTALYLLEHGHRGRVTLTSKNGLLPTVRTRAPARPLRYLSHAAVRAALAVDPVMTVERLLDLLDAELREVGTRRARACVEAQPGEPVDRRLTRQLAEARAGGARWQPVIIEAMHESVDLLWQAMDETEHRRFLDHWHRRFITLLSPMPEWTATRLKEAADAGRLHVLPNVCGVRRRTGPAEAGFVASFHDAPDDGADIVVNTIRPPSARTPAGAVPLVLDLVGSGMARFHPLGGVDVAPATNRVLDADGRQAEGLFAVGHLTTGAHYYTSSMLIIGRQAKVVADQVLADAAAPAPAARPTTRERGGSP